MVLLGAVGETIFTELAVNTVSLVVPVLVKNRFVPLYSMAPVSAVVKFIPEVNFKGAVPEVDVPAPICK